jgi:hypothetical protein
MKTLPANQRIDVPPQVAVCPYCDGDVPLYAECESWHQRDDGTWEADGIRLECTSEPELEEGCDEATEDAWQDWLDAHTVMPYVYWLPVDRRVLSWINKNFRFDVEESK